jgi:ABC-2 type transport system ATP-binding protein
MIQLTGVVKEYGGPFRRRVRALDGVTLRVEPGTALGVIGLNGAGKSTLLRLLLGYVRPTQGEATIGGVPPRSYAEREGIGYVPERVAIPARWTVRGALQAYAMLGAPGDDAWQRVDTALERLGLRELAGRRVGELSKGNLQRLALAQAFLAERRVLVLDEPTDGLDPEWIARLREILALWRAADPQRVVVCASHNLPEVERLSDRVVVLHEGTVREELDLRAGPHPGGTLEERFLARVQGWRGGAG